ncbi:MAG: NAD(P)/FAD-dependent oxidoreductase [Bacteroidales bacterium]|nr:NAD(P)/FAD-dependent oxidoreductase [Candidatus Colimorpha merdihippi]
MSKVIVVGAGAAGMMAAITAAEQGAEVVLIEKMDQAGRKLRITGKGRCNLTNTVPLKEYIGHIGPDGRWMRNCFAQLFNTQLMDFFENHGVPLVEERGHRVFPQSGKSLDIFLALINDLENRSNVEIRKNCAVKSLTDDRHGVRLQDGTTIRGDKVIIATGGLSYPTTGSTGIGYRLAEEAGHTVVPQVPSLVSLTCQEPIPSELVGFALKNVGLTITRPDGKKLYEAFGEMTFTPNGIDGPIVLSASRQVSRILNGGEALIAHLDLKPALTSEKLDHRLITDLDSNGTRLFHDALRMWLPAELIQLALDRLHIEYYKRLHQVNGAERKRLLTFLKDCQFTLTGTGDYNTAIVTQGGIDTKEINPKTMESKLVPGLFFAGEVLDLDADTGGFNLQIAFSTGYAAGKAAGANEMQ